MEDNTEDELLVSHMTTLAVIAIEFVFSALVLIFVITSIYDSALGRDTTAMNLYSFIMIPVAFVLAIPALVLKTNAKKGLKKKPESGQNSKQAKRQLMILQLCNLNLIIIAMPFVILISALIIEDIYR